MFQWIHRYRVSWFLQDMIAGVTVGMLLVAQGIAYAKIANLDPQYGLYTAFVGACIYCFLGTSKDISIGPITILPPLAVVSLLVGQCIKTVHSARPEISAPEVAVCLSLFSGIVIVVIGIVKLGILVDFISGPVIAGYMTGSAITIAFGQWPKLFGMSGVDTHDPPYLIFIHFFANLPSTQLDAAFGLISLAFLYTIRYGCPWLTRKFPQFGRPLFFLGIMRSALVVVFGTLISFLINRGKSESPISLVETIPVGFDAMGVPRLNLTVISNVIGSLPSIIIILLLEHITVAKSFGNVSNYTIRPNQEILAIGISNVIGSFFGAYPATGAFSRTAVMSRSGSKTPLAGIFSSAIVALALYALTPAFYYVPNATLAAVVVHAVSDLISGPRYIRELWKTSLLEFFVFFVSVVVACFVDVETAIYVSISLSLVIMLFRLARPSVKTLGRYPLDTAPSSCYYESSRTAVSQQPQRFVYVDDGEPLFTKFLEPLPRGLLIVRPGNAMLYPNAAYITEKITQVVKDRTCKGSSEESADEQLWNQDTEELESTKEDCLSVLEALVLDMGAVSRIDPTALQALARTRQMIDNYSGRPVEWHFANLQTKQVRNDLVATGFGDISSFQPDRSEEVTQAGSESFKEMPAPDASRETTDVNYTDINFEQQRAFPVPRDQHRYFHWDVETAVQAICENWNSSFSTKCLA
ncbi:hypothetical protein DFQ28_005736 [Apophysomyces sp. BC1034]|nr:hypothetical protein DFQ28_005736 [Apophysomyces sp. BC1034]